MGKILFVLPSINKGGAEKVMLDIFNTLESFEKKLVIFQAQDIRMENTITFRSIKLRDNIINLIKVIKAEKPDIIMSSHYHINIFLILYKILFKVQSKVVVRQPFTLSNLANNSLIFKFTAKLYKYPDLVIFQSNHMYNDFKKVTNLKLDNAKVIYNPIKENSFEKEEQTKESFYIAVGSLKPVKNFSYLIKKYANSFIVNNNLPPLFIIGEGPERERLQNLISQYNLQEKIRLVGQVEDMSSYYKKANTLIISSLSEGLPNVLLEALAYKLNVIVRKHPGGTQEVLEKVGLEKNFVNEIDLTSNRLVMTDEKHQEALKTHFGMEKIIKDYKRELYNLVSKGRV